MTTLSKLKQEGREEFEKVFSFPELEYPTTGFGHIPKRNWIITSDIASKFGNLLTAQIQKAYLQALKDVEKGLPLELHTDRLHTLTKEHHVGYNHALSEVREAINKLKKTK